MEEITFEDKELLSYFEAADAAIQQLQAGEDTQLAEKAIQNYYTAPLEAIWIDRYLRQQYPAIRWLEQLEIKSPLWSPRMESEVLARLRADIRCIKTMMQSRCAQEELA